MKKRLAAALNFAPREIFEKILEYAVIPTFDLIVRLGDRGVILVHRKIAPYRNTGPSGTQDDEA